MEIITVNLITRDNSNATTEIIYNGNATTEMIY